MNKKILYIGNYAPWIFQNLKFYEKYSDYYVYPINGYEIENKCFKHNKD